MSKNESKFIPVHEPDLDNLDYKSVLSTLKKGEISGSFTNTINLFEKKFAKFCNVKYAVSVSNCTNALQLACRVVGIRKNDEVLVSSSTNIADALAVYHNDGIPIPIDSDPNTWNLDVNELEKKITKKTKAILPTHFLGLPADMLKIMKIAKRYKLKVIEDCAQSPDAKIHGRKVGSFGDLGCYSFYSNKIITTGEGGMVVTNNYKYYKKLVYLKNLAFGKPRFFHKVDGYNFRLGSLQAALGLSQLKKVRKFIKKKRNIAKLYFKYLKNVEGIRLPFIHKDYYNVYWMFGIQITKECKKNRTQLIKFLNNNNIETRTFFCPLNLQPFLKKIKNYKKNKCPVANRMWHEGIYLPSGNNLKKNEVKKICNLIVKFTTS